MYTMHEALARERMREQQERSRRAHLAGELARARRWHRRELHARSAYRRHAQLAQRAASAVAEVVR